MSNALNAAAYPICSQASMALGGQPITANTDSAAHDYLRYGYEEIKKYLLTVHPWRFATKQIKVSPTKRDGGFYLDIPADLLRVVRFDKDADFLKEGNRFKLASEVSTLNYLYNIPEGAMPSYFRRVLVDFLVANLVLLFSGSISQTDFFTRKAEHTLRVAIKTDAPHQPVKKITRFPFIEARR